MSRTVAERSPATRASVHTGPFRTPRVVLAGIVMITAQLVYRAWMTYGAWFHIDDFNFISRMGHSGLSISSVGREYMGHLMPGGLLLSWANQSLAPFDWRLPATELLVMQLLADVALLVLLLRLFGPRWGILPPLAVYLFGVGTVPLGIWWAAGVNQLPMHIALFVGLTCHLAYLRTRRPQALAWALVSVVGGLLFWEKSILVLLAFGLLTVCYFAVGSFGERLALVWSGYRAAVVAYVALGLAYLTLYVTTSLTFDPGRAAEYPLFGVMGNMVLRAYVPATVGGPLQWIHLADQPGSAPQPSDPTIAVSLVLVALLVREIHRSRARSLRAWSFPAVFLASNVLLVLAARTSYVGDLLSLDFRYQGELPGVTAIALGLATLRVIDARESATPRAPSRFLDSRRAVTVATTAFAVLASVSGWQYAHHWMSDHGSERYVARVAASLRSAPEPVPLVDRPVPLTLTWGTNYPDNLFSRVFGTYRSATEFPKAATDRLLTFDETGHLTRVVIDAARRNLPGPEAGCGYRVARDPVTVPLDGPVAFNDWWVRIGYLATEDGAATVSAGSQSHRVPILKGLHELFVQASGEFDSVTISGIDGGAELCSDDVTVGLPEALDKAVP